MRRITSVARACARRVDFRESASNFDTEWSRRVSRLWTIQYAQTRCVRGPRLFRTLLDRFPNRRDWKLETEILEVRTNDTPDTVVGRRRARGPCPRVRGGLSLYCLFSLSLSLSQTCVVGARRGDAHLKEATQDERRGRRICALFARFCSRERERDRARRRAAGGGVVERERRVEAVSVGEAAERLRAPATQRERIDWVSSLRISLCGRWTPVFAWRPPTRASA